MSGFDAAHVCEGCNERPACVKVGYWVCGGRCYQDALRDYSPDDWDARGGHDCRHTGMAGLPVCLICREKLAPCVCGEDHDCRATGCDDDCEACNA